MTARLPVAPAGCKERVPSDNADVLKSSNAAVRQMKKPAPDKRIRRARDEIAGNIVVCPIFKNACLIMCPKTAPNEPGKRSEEHTSELQSRGHLVCRLLLEKT